MPATTTLNETVATTNTMPTVSETTNVDTQVLEQQYASEAYTMEGDTYAENQEYDSNYYSEYGEENYYDGNDEGWTGMGAWVQYTDEESGSPYWYNHDTGETTWDDPTGVEGGGGDASYYEEYGEQAHDEVAAA